MMLPSKTVVVLAALAIWLTGCSKGDDSAAQSPPPTTVKKKEKEAIIPPVVIAQQAVINEVQDKPIITCITSVDLAVVVNVEVKNYQEKDKFHEVKLVCTLKDKAQGEKGKGLIWSLRTEISKELLSSQFRVGDSVKIKEEAMKGNEGHEGVMKIKGVQYHRFTDGRDVDEFAPIKLEKHVYYNMEGSEMHDNYGPFKHSILEKVP